MVDCYYSLHLLGAMDRLWFQQIILFPQEPSINPLNLISETTSKPLHHLPKTKPISHIQSNSAPNLSSTLILEDHEEFISSSSSSETSPITSQDCLEVEELNYKKKRPARLSTLGTKSLPRSSAKKLPKKLRNGGGEESKLKKTMSCKSLCELEYEEVKGFMDLGFRFKKEELNSRMMRIVPGLQRMIDQESNYEDEVEIEIERPYLSEAWLIKKPNSPLLNLKMMPPVSASNDMKKHLRSWAKIVATSIQLEY